MTEEADPVAVRIEGTNLVVHGKDGILYRSDFPKDNNALKGWMARNDFQAIEDPRFGIRVQIEGPNTVVRDSFGNEILYRSDTPKTDTLMARYLYILQKK